MIAPPCVFHAAPDHLGTIGEADLSADELLRLARLRYPIRQAEKRALWALRRRTLPLVSGTPQRFARLSFRYAPTGAPEPLAPSGLHHSLTATATLVSVFWSQAPCGIDAERIDGVPDGFEAALTPDERRRLALAHDPAALFTRIWTAKEAASKLFGTGFRVDPSMFEVEQDEPRGRVRLPDGRNLHCRWTEPVSGTLLCTAAEDDRPIRIEAFRPTCARGPEAEATSASRSASR